MVPRILTHTCRSSTSYRLVRVGTSRNEVTRAVGRCQSPGVPVPTVPVPHCDSGAPPRVVACANGRRDVTRVERQVVITPVRQELPGRIQMDRKDTPRLALSGTRMHPNLPGEKSEHLGNKVSFTGLTVQKGVIVSFLWAVPESYCGWSCVS